MSPKATAPHSTRGITLARDHTNGPMLFAKRSVSLQGKEQTERRFDASAMQASAMQACYRRSWRLACPATWRRPAQPQLRRVAVAAAEPDHQPDGAPHATRPHPPAGPPAAAGTRRQLLLAAAVLAASAAAGDGASRAAPAAAPPGALEGPSVVDVEQLRINAMQVRWAAAGEAWPPRASVMCVVTTQLATETKTLRGCAGLQPCL